MLFVVNSLLCRTLILLVFQFILLISVIQVFHRPSNSLRMIFLYPPIFPCFIRGQSSKTSNFQSIYLLEFFSVFYHTRLRLNLSYQLSGCSYFIRLLNLPQGLFPIKREQQKLFDSVMRKVHGVHQHKMICNIKPLLSLGLVTEFWKETRQRNDWNYSSRQRTVDIEKQDQKGK